MTPVACVRVRPDPAAADLFGLVAYGELLAFDRLAADARLAPTCAAAPPSEMAATEIAHYRWLTDRLAACGVTPEEAMAPTSRRCGRTTTRPSRGTGRRR
ncbi:ferritin-like fold-containing protein [Micromonospora sp. BRA006-A]|nr:ferritin-like fold-containing protein [Micromonospora sp. BRA006-A]